jgi:uncharacterized protein YndB with AHSA1/START domain
MIAGDQARVSVLVKVPPDIAFRVFTEEIDQWWRRGLAYRIAGRDPQRGIIHLEAGVGGRLFESYQSKSGAARVHESGRVTVWEPPARLVFEWRAVNFKAPEATEVEVLFEPSPSGTLVTVTHRGWSAIRPDHPARHGQEVAIFLGRMGMWWGDLMTALREHASRDRQGR